MLMQSFLCLTLLSVVFGAGTILDINSGTASSRPDFLVIYNGTLYFRASQDGSTINLWSTSGGIQLDSWPLAEAVLGLYPAFITPFMGNLVMSGDDGQGTQIWTFNPTASPWYSEISFSEGSFNPGQPDGFLEHDGKLIFAGASVESGIPQSWTVLYSFDGSQVSQISIATSPRYAISFLGAVYFSANGGPSIGQELYTWDEASGEARVSDFNGYRSSYPSFLTIFNDKLYFSMLSDTFGTELASFDGSSFLIEADINPGLPGSNPANLIVFNGKLYFSAMSDSATGVELWSYDGLYPTLVADINPTGNSYPAAFAVVWDLLLFSADDGTHGFELWAHDGNKTWMVADLNPGSAHSNPSNFIEFDDDIYFVAESAQTGRELWISNGIIPNPNNSTNSTNSTEVCSSVNTECQLDDECCTGYCDLGGPMPAKPQHSPPPNKTRPIMQNHTDDNNVTESHQPYPKRRDAKLDPKTGPPTAGPSSSYPPTSSSYPPTTSPGYGPSPGPVVPTNSTNPPKSPPSQFNNTSPKVPVPFSKGKAAGSTGSWSYRCLCRPEKMECSSGSQCCSGACVRWVGGTDKMSRGSKGTKHTPHPKGSYSKGSKTGESEGNMTNTTYEEEVVWVCGPAEARASGFRKNFARNVGVGVGVGFGVGALLTVGVLTRRSILRRREASDAQSTETATESVAMTEPSVPAFKFVPAQTFERVDA